jgi:signal transduction histidine kinase
MAEVTTRSFNRLEDAAVLARPLVRRAFRDIRYTVPICIILICGCLAAAALLQMRLDRSHALAQAAAFERARVAAVARATGRTLDRYARLGEVFASAPQQYRSAELGRSEPAIRDILVWDADGRQQAGLQASAQASPKPAFNGARTSTSDSLAFRNGGQVIAVRFDPKSLDLGSARLLPQTGAQGESITARIPGWPLAVTASLDEKGALEKWGQTLPLYLFVILGPAVVGAWLAALFVGAFERQARAARAIRALKSTRPVEARLMVRLANAERGAKEALRSKSEFIAHMSHELRTPLNAVIGFSEIIAGEFFGPSGHPKYGEYARDIGEAGRNLHAKIGDILEFANIEAGRYPLRAEAVDLAALALACVDEQQGRAFSRRISLSLAFGESGQVRADAGAVRRILTNLIVNALAYTAEGGMVRAEVRFQEGAGILTVSDSGAGFNTRESALAGKPFQRFDRKSGVTGAGLGLAIAMELARLMGGAVRVASGNAPNARGAIMEVRLPRL